MAKPRTKKRALHWLSNDLRYANIGLELDARVVARPTDEAMADAQGDGVAHVDRWRKDNKFVLESFGKWAQRDFKARSTK